MTIYSGQVTHTTVGSLAFTTTIEGTYRIKPLSTNSSPVFVGNTTGIVTTATGYELTTGRDYLDVTVTNLNQLYLRVVTAADGVCWHRLEGAIVGVKPPA